MTEPNAELGMDDVRHLAELARVGASEADLEQMRRDLVNILENFTVLEEVDTAGVEPTGHANAVENVFREDVSRPSISREDVLKNAPTAQEGYVRVRGVFDE